jgi:hypothetical protein
MSDLFDTGRIVDLILALMLAETVVLAGYHYATGRGISLLSLLANMAAGAFLLLAVRAALTAAPWGAVAAALGSAFAMHALDMRSRWSLDRNTQTPGANPIYPAVTDTRACSDEIEPRTRHRRACPGDPD